MDQRLAFALNTAYQAGRSTLAHFNNLESVEIKSDDSPVTIADKQAESLIRAAISKTYPKDSILGEEEGASGSSLTRWVIDPIDGTKSFVAGVPLFATLLSFEIEGVPEIGIAYIPALDEMYYAKRGEGAYCNGRPISVSNASTLKGGTLLCGGHKTLMERGRLEGFLELVPGTRATRTWGDAFGHIMVASGRAEAMIDPRVNRWDISSVSLIVQEAGGTWTTFDGKQDLTDEAISSNGKVHNEVLAAFHPLDNSGS